MAVSIHIDPDFAAIRAQMRRYPPYVITRATVRTLNRLGAQARRATLKEIAREHRTKQKNLNKKIKLQKATKDKQRVIIGFSMSRGSVLITPGSLFRHLQTDALHRRLLKDPRYHGQNPATLPFIQSPRGYGMAFERSGKSRYPIKPIRIDLGPIWTRLQSTLSASARSKFGPEWTRNANHYKARSGLK